MSFSFNTATTTSGGTFGTTTPATGFSFASGDNKTMFGASNTENKPAFNFTSPTSTFSFGAAKTTAATSSLFSSPAATSAGSSFGASKPLNFGGFQSPPNQTVGSSLFGQPAAQQNAPQSLTMDGTQQQQVAPTFGTPTTQAGATSTFGASPSGGAFSFNKAASPAPATGFGFATPASGFSAPQTATTTTSTAPLTTQSSVLAQSSATSFGTTSAFGAKPGSAFSFSGAQQTGFGANNAAAPTPATGFSLTGQQPQQQQPQQQQPQQQQPQQQQQQQPTATQTGFGFGTTGTGLSFGQTASTAGSTFQSPSALSFGTATTAAATGLGSFGTTTTVPQSTAPPSYGASPLLSSQPSTGLSFNTTPGLSKATVGITQPFSSSTGRAPGLSFATTTTSQPTSFATSAAQPTPGLNFGTTTVSQAPKSFGIATTTGLNFGTTTSTTGLSFSTPAATTGLSFATTTSTTGLSFSSPAATTGLNFGTTTATTSSTGLNFSTAVTSATATTSSGFGFTGPNTSTGLGFGLKSTTTSATSTALTSAPSGIMALGKTTSTLAPTTTTTTTIAAPPQPITSITFAQLEENINKWTLELEEQEKTFINQATQINAWDRLLIANGEKIVELNDAVQTVKNEQQSLEHELDFVLAQQKELEDLLAPMEKQLLVETADRLRDPEREHMYTLAENLDSQLRQMSEDLKEVIEHLNETNRSQDTNDPIVQIGRILNAHMSSMQWIDNSIAQITTKLDQLKATHDTLRRDNERSFQLTYN